MQIFAASVKLSSGDEASSLRSEHHHHGRHGHHHRHHKAAVVAPPPIEAPPHHHHHHHGHHGHHKHQDASFLHAASAVQEKQHIDTKSVSNGDALDPKSAALLRSTADVTAKRPIITGCLKECGAEDQTCVTQCQVCTEQNECRILGNCEPCLAEAHRAKDRAKKAEAVTLDSGGAALVRDGLLAEMTRAKIFARDKERDVRAARTRVLKAQRAAEWAAQERHLSAGRLTESSQHLKGTRQEVARWKLQNAKKLQEKRARARERRQERQEAERKLEAEKKKYHEAQRKLKDVSTHSNATNVTSSNSSNRTNASTVDKQAEEDAEMWRRTREMEARQKAVEQAEKDVEKTSADGEWLDRGLRRRVKSAQQNARNSREELLESRARERVGRDRLEEEKQNYIKAAKAAQQAAKAAEEAEKRLRAAPLPDKYNADHQKKDKTNSTDVLKDLSLKSSSRIRSPGFAIMALLTLFKLLPA